jgi:cyclopropane fatty-acyl-phospholipid synthase-like methyltransferase
MFFGILSEMKKAYISFAGHGVDVASQRADDLDNLCLKHIAAKSAARVLDLGAGAGGQSLRMVEAGATVIAVDSYDFGEVFAKLRADNAIDKTQLQFIRGDISSIPAQWTKDKVTDAIVQRTIHYLQYEAAQQLLNHLYKKVADKLFISVTGIHSAVGVEYAGRAVAVKERFSPLAPEQAQTFSISQPVCLYSAEEFVALLETNGWKVERWWESAFGNIKAVCTH